MKRIYQIDQDDWLQLHKIGLVTILGKKLKGGQGIDDFEVDTSIQTEPNHLDLDSDACSCGNTSASHEESNVAFGPTESNLPGYRCPHDQVFEREAQRPFLSRMDSRYGESLLVAS